MYTGKTEVGQNIRTSLTQAVAEELRLPITAIRLVMTIYNPLCQPPWELRDIEHKVDDAMKKRR